MTYYDVHIGEQILHRLTVQASSQEEAIAKAREALANLPEEFLRHDYEYQIAHSEFDGEQTAEELEL